MNELDLRSIPCPGPVIRTKKALEESGGAPLRVLADAGAARENITRFVVNRGYGVTEEQLNEGFALTISRSGAGPLTETGMTAAGGGVILVASDRLGIGPDDLGSLLMKNFLISLLEVKEPPERIFFINSGVLLALDGAETLESLKKLADAGVEIMSCGVCLDYFSARDRLAVGTITNMLVIAETLLEGKTVIRL